VNIKLLALATATALASGAGILTPMAVLAQTGNSPDTVYFTSDGAGKDHDAKNKDLDARLAEAQARLEKAAHDVAELSSEIGGPLMDKFMVFNGEGPSRAIIGVQLDSESGKGGARIQEVSPGGPADEAGLHVGDVITAINGTDVKGDSPARQVMHVMHEIAPESKVKVRITREGKSRDFVVTARRGATFFGMQHPNIPLPPIPPGFPEAGVSTFGPVMIHGQLGEMELATLTPQLGRYFGTDKGVLVVRAPKDFKLEDGDVILAIDGREPSSGSHATRILSSYQSGEKITIKLMRQQKTVNVETTLPERMSFMGSGRDRRVRLIRKDATT
jgi:membrane-associated protease RseP (regulator of RpoE activity)